ncbi:LysM domain-containing GPI-anchored protein 1 [Sesamum angolense]|uniref:LysM domain-containing GPI-anchored protein 1 n=1 Tax=Sesamum angolense TaxID=2727404 RepID=A0AAE1WCZ2_9LAMI|nr:LysM domain-containing GPI-anchored protein 1 [Sesamum angolense]
MPAVSLPAILILVVLSLLGALLPRATPKSTIEPCSTFDSCTSLVGYTLYTDLKVSEVASIFSVDPISLLLTNAIDISYPDVENHILPSQLFLKIPIPCSCVDGIRKSNSLSYKTRPSDTLSSISSAVYGGLVSADQIMQANPDAELSDPSVISVGTKLNIPLPCTCFNNSDNNLPAVYMSYVVRDVDTLGGIAARYVTTVSDLMNVNALGSPDIKGVIFLQFHCRFFDDVVIMQSPYSIFSCASNFPNYAGDYALVVPNGSYAIAASHCLQCSCAQGSRNLYCMPASLAVSCSSMQCPNSNLMIGNSTIQQSSAGCNVTSCSYGGFVNGSISAILSTSLQPRCPGSQQFPPLIAPPTVVPDSLFAPAPSPSESGGIPTSTVVPSSGTVLGFPPANGPSSNALGYSGTCPSMGQLTGFHILLVLGLIAKHVSSIQF